MILIHIFCVDICLTLTELQSESKANTEELEKLQEIITTCTLQLEKSEEKNKQLTENLIGI